MKAALLNSQSGFFVSVKIGPRSEYCIDRSYYYQCNLQWYSSYR